jgi:hypothetical protein
MKPTACPSCRRPLPEMRLGIRLTPFKARLFDAISHSGDGGIMLDDLYEIVCTEGQSRKTLVVHIWQINDLLEDEGYRIKGGRYGYRLRKVQP